MIQMLPHGSVYGSTTPASCEANLQSMLVPTPQADRNKTTRINFMTNSFVSCSKPTTTFPRMVNAMRQHASGFPDRIFLSGCVVGLPGNLYVAVGFQQLTLTVSYVPALEFTLTSTVFTIVFIDLVLRN